MALYWLEVDPDGEFHTPKISKASVENFIFIGLSLLLSSDVNDKEVGGAAGSKRVRIRSASYSHWIKY